MKKIPKKINTKECTKSSNSKVFHYKKDVETVLRLTIKQYNEPPFTALNSRAKALSMSPIRNNIKRLSMRKNINSSIKENNNNNIQYDKYRKELNRFSDSLKQLKTSFPNNTEIKELEKSIGIMAPVRLEHIKLENNLKDQIHEIDMQETSLQSTKDLLEAQMITIDRRIMDQELNKEVALEMEKENNNKIIKDKLINELQNQFLSKDKENNDSNSNNINNNIKIKKRTLTSSREFQERLELYMKREEYLTKQKEKEIEKDIINNKQNKKTVIEQLNSINDNLKNLHKIRNFFIQKLYEHYLNVLKDGKDTRNEGLSWVIREIFALDKKVMLSYMPKFLDKCCIKYIFDMTHLNIKITEVENQIKKTKEEFKKVGIINKGDESLVNESIIKANQHKRNLNEITKNYWEKIRQTFGSNNKFINKKNFLNKNLELNLDDNNNNKVNGNKTFKKKSVFLNIPFIAGDPNAITISIPNNEISHINKLLKDGQKQNEKIPDVLKIKDYEKLSHNSGYFLNNEEIKKVQNYLSLKNKLNSLRKKKETMKTNEMTRIFKEFQRNDYENRFNIDKITVISALIGEDNLNSELVKQTKREKKYIEEIMKGRMHKKMKSVDKAMMEKNLLGENINPLNKMVKSMEGFEMNNRVEILSYNKAFENASGQYGLTF